MGTRAEDDYRRQMQQVDPLLRLAIEHTSQRAHVKRREHSHRAARAAMRRL